MLKIITTLVATVLVFVLLGAAVLYSGAVNVAADDPYSAPVAALLEYGRERSITLRAQAVEVPDLSDASLIQSGAGDYETMCVGCHLAPGVQPTELHQNLYPSPPNLAEVDIERDPARMFWTIKHGIKGTGMAAWGKSIGDEYIWGLVAFLEQLPAMSALDYQAVLAASTGYQQDGGEVWLHPSDEDAIEEDQTDTELPFQLDSEDSQQAD